MSKPLQSAAPGHPEQPGESPAAPRATTAEVTQKKSDAPVTPRERPLEVPGYGSGDSFV